jgi:PAS fold
VAIFSPAGHLVVSNAAYASLWNTDARETIGGVTLQDSVRLWSSQSQDRDLWLQAADFVSDIDAEVPDPAGVELADGRVVTCRFRRLPGGSSMIGFRTLTPERLAARRLRKKPRAEPDISAAVV